MAYAALTHYLALPVRVPCLETCLRRVGYSIGHPNRMILVLVVE